MRALAKSRKCSILNCRMVRKSVYRAVADIDRQALAEFQAGIRKRYTDEQRGQLPSKSLYWHTFGSLTNALREAGFDVPVGEERRERALDQAVRLSKTLGRLPKFADWTEARKADDALLTEWQIYRMFDARRGAWSTFQFLVRERLREAGVDVGADGTIS